MKTKFLFAAVILGMSLSLTSCFPPREGRQNHHEQSHHNNNNEGNDNHNDDDGGRH